MATLVIIKVSGHKYYAFTNKETWEVKKGQGEKQIRNQCQKRSLYELQRELQASIMILRQHSPARSEIALGVGIYRTHADTRGDCGTLAGALPISMIEVGTCRGRASLFRLQMTGSVIGTAATIAKAWLGLTGAQDHLPESRMTATPCLYATSTRPCFCME